MQGLPTSTSRTRTLPMSQTTATAKPISPAVADLRHRVPEQGRDLRPAVQGERRDAADDRGRSEASRREDRLHLGAAYLGFRHDPPSARAHDRAGRWHITRRITLDQQRGGLSTAGASAVAHVPGYDAGDAEDGAQRRPPA